MDLDDLTEMIEGRGSKKQIFAGESDDDSEAPDEVKAVSHLIDDDEQEKSDLEDEIDDGSDSNDEGGNSDEDSGDDIDIDVDEDNEAEDDMDMDEEEIEVEETDGIDGDDIGSADGESDNADSNGEEEEEDEDEDNEIESSSHTYQPSKGEDIYGRMTASAVTESTAGGKYVPPARRAQLLATIDEVSCYQAEHLYAPSLLISYSVYWDIPSLL